MQTDVNLKKLFKDCGQDLVWLTGDREASVLSVDVLELQEIKRSVDCVIGLRRGEFVGFGNRLGGYGHIRTGSPPAGQRSRGPVPAVAPAHPGHRAVPASGRRRAAPQCSMPCSTRVPP